MLFVKEVAHGFITTGCVATPGAGLLKVEFIHGGGTPARQWPFKWRHFRCRIGSVADVLLVFE